MIIFLEHRSMVLLVLSRTHGYHWLLLLHQIRARRKRSTHKLECRIHRSSFGAHIFSSCEWAGWMMLSRWQKKIPWILFDEYKNPIENRGHEWVLFFCSGRCWCRAHFILFYFSISVCVCVFPFVLSLSYLEHCVEFIVASSVSPFVCLANTFM